MKKNLIVAALLGALAVLTPRAWSGNGPDSMAAKADMSGYSAVVLGGAGKSNLLTLYYIGTSTEALVTVSGTDMSFFAPYNTPEATLSSTGGIGTAGVVTYGTTFSGYSAGGLCDYINTSKYYRCVLTGAVRGDGAAILKTQSESSGTCNLGAPGGCTLTNNAVDIIRLGIIPSIGKRVVLNHIETLSVASTDTVNVWGIPRKYSNMIDQVGNQLTPGATQWLTTTGAAGSIAYQPAAGQYQLFPWMDFAPNQILTIQNGHAVTSGCNYTWGSGFCLNGNTYDGSVTVGVGSTGSGATETSANSMRVFWSELGL